MKSGWEIKKLKDIAEYTIGLTYSPSDVGDQGTVVLRSSNVQDGKLDLTDIVRVKSKIKPHLYVQPGDILMCSRNGSKRLVGKATVIGNLSEQMTFGTFMTVIRSQYNPYLSWFFVSDLFREQIGIGENPMINQITKYMLDDINVPVPPIEEQRRIVAILDEAFACIDKAKANTEKNIQNARELFDSYLNNIFSNPGPDWEQNELKSVCEKITKGSSPKWQGINYVNEPGVLFVTSENVGNGEMIFEKRKYVEDRFNSLEKRSILRKGDVLTNIVGASIGRTAVFDQDEVANINQAVCVLRCNPEKLVNMYLVGLLNSPFFLRVLSDGESNMARSNLSLGFFSDLRIPVPSVDTQREITNKISNIRARISEIESNFRRQIAKLDETRKAVLQKAFSGQIGLRGRFYDG